MTRINFTVGPTLIWQFWAHSILIFWSILIWQFLTHISILLAHIILTFGPILSWQIYPILIWRTYNLDGTFCCERNVARFAGKVKKWDILWNFQIQWRTTILTELPSRNPLERKCIILSGKKGRAAEQMEKRVNVTIAWVLLILLLHNDNQGNYNWGNLIIHLGTFNYKVGPLKELQYYCGRENSKVFKFFFSSNCGLWGCGHETIELRKRSWSSNCKTCTLPIEVLKMIGMIINAGKIPTALYMSITIAYFI